MIDLGPNMPMSKNFHFGDVEFANLAKFQVTFQNWTSSGGSESEVELWTRFAHQHLCRPPSEPRSAEIWRGCLRLASIDGNSQYCPITRSILVLRLRQTWNYGIPRYQVSISLEGELDDLNTKGRIIKDEHYGKIREIMVLRMSITGVRKILKPGRAGERKGHKTKGKWHNSNLIPLYIIKSQF